MAEPVRNNSILPAASFGAAVEGAPAATDSAAAPIVLAQADTTEQGSARAAASAISGGAASSGAVPPQPEVQSRPALQQQGPRTEETPPQRVRIEGVATADADRAMAESQRVLKRFTGTGIAGNLHTFKPSVVFRDNQGEVHVRMQRYFRGIPVFGEQSITHFDRSNNVTDVTNGPTPAGLATTTRATVTKDQAKTTAIAAFGSPAPQTITEPELVIIKGNDGKYVLAYHLVLTNMSGREPRRMNFFVDANTNTVAVAYNQIHGIVPEFKQPNGAVRAAPQAAPQEAAAGWPRLPRLPFPRAPRHPWPRTPGNVPAAPKPGPAVGTGDSLYLGNVPLNTVRQADGTYVLRDARHRNTETRDHHNRDAGEVGADGFPEGATVITDNNNRWGEATDTAGDRAAIDANYVASKYDDYMREMFGRNGIDNNGVPGRAVIHTNEQMVNAFYYKNVMWYGDGDGVTAGPLVDKDVASHEPTHGLTEHTSGLIYRGESGALNEAVSDIIGSAGFSWYLRGRKDQGIASDYLVGEDCWTPGQEGDALRYMANPTADRQGPGEGYSRDHYSTRYTGWQDNGGVHLNSGIANNWFYLIANGGENPTSKMAVEGMGMEKALNVIYRASTVYFTPSTTFAEARVACIKAAEDLYGKGSKEAAIVATGWSAVGVEPAAVEADRAA